MDFSDFYYSLMILADKIFIYISSKYGHFAGLQLFRFIHRVN